MELDICWIFWTRLRSRFWSALLGAMTLPFGCRSSKLVLFHLVKMYHSLTRQKLRTARRTYWPHLLSTLVFKEFVERRKLLEEKLINHSFWLGLCTAFRVRQRSKSSFDCFQSVFLEIQQGLWGETVKPKLKREWDETWLDSPATFRTQRYLPLRWRSRYTLLSDPNTKDQLSAV